MMVPCTTSVLVQDSFMKIVMFWYMFLTFEVS